MHLLYHQAKWNMFLPNIKDYLETKSLRKEKEILMCIKQDVPDAVVRAYLVVQSAVDVDHTDQNNVFSIASVNISPMLYLHF